MHTRRLAAIMFTDIAGYTALMQSDEKQALKIRNRHREVFEARHKAFNGTILQYYGDGTLSIFDSAIEAVNCAVSMQLAFQKEPKVPLRIGIHTGDILYSEEEVIGDGVNVASRVESMAVPGSIMISDSVYKYLKNQSDLPLKEMGSFQFKNVDRPMDIYAVEKDGLVVPIPAELRGKFTKAKKPKTESFLNRIPVWGKYLGGLALFLLLAPILYFPVFNFISGNAQETISVMNEDGEEISREIIRNEDKKRFWVGKFTNLDQNEETDWLSVGFPYALEMDWDQDPYIFNIFDERTRASTLNAQIEAAKNKECEYVFLGEYKKDTAYHVNVKVFDVASSQEKFQLSFTGKNLFSFMDEISLRVKQELGVPEKHLENTIDLPVAQFLTNSEEAYELFIKGIIIAATQGSGALPDLTLAADTDPEFVWANYIVSLFHHKYQRSRKKAKEYSKRAMKSRSRLPDIFEINVRILNYKVNNEYEKALKLTEMLEELNPGNSTYMNQLLTEYFEQGEYEKLVDKIEERRKISGIADANWSLEIIAYSRLGEFKKVEKLAEDRIEENPEDIHAHRLLGKAHLLQHDWEEARAVYDKISLLNPDLSFIRAYKHIEFMEDSVDHFDFEELYTRFKGKYWIEDLANFEIDILVEHEQFFIYPPSQRKMQLYAFGKYRYAALQGFAVNFVENEEGEVVKMKLYEGRSNPYFAIKILPEVEKAISLFNDRAFDKAEPLLKELIPKNAHLPILKALLDHIEFSKKEAFAKRKAAYSDLIGTYKGGQVGTELMIIDDELYMDISGVPVYQEAFHLFEIEPGVFANLKALNGRTKIVRKNGKVVGLELTMSGDSGVLFMEKE